MTLNIPEILKARRGGAGDEDILGVLIGDDPETQEVAQRALNAGLTHTDLLFSALKGAQESKQENQRLICFVVVCVSGGR